jgi:hypothetical protein
LSSYAVDTPSGEIAAKADVICPWADLSPGSACADWLPFGTVPESFVRLATVAGGGRGLVFEMPGRYDLTTETRGGWIRVAVNSRTKLLASFSDRRTVLVGVVDGELLTETEQPGIGPRTVSLYLIHPESGRIVLTSRMRETHRVAPVSYDWDTSAHATGPHDVAWTKEVKEVKGDETKITTLGPVRGRPLPEATIVPADVEDYVPELEDPDDLDIPTLSSIAAAWIVPMQDTITANKSSVSRRFAVPESLRHNLLIVASPQVAITIYGSMLTTRTRACEMSGYDAVHMAFVPPDVSGGTVAEALYGIARAGPGARGPIPHPIAIDTSESKWMIAAPGTAAPASDWLKTWATNATDRPVVAVCDLSMFILPDATREFNVAIGNRFVDRLLSVRQIMVWSFLCPRQNERHIAACCSELKYQYTDVQYIKDDERHMVIVYRTATGRPGHF